MVLRDLITRLGFEVDDREVKKYDQTVGGIKKSAFKLAGILGAAFSVRNLFKLGTEKTRVDFQFRRLAGSAKDSFLKVFDTVKGELNGIKEGAGNVFEKFKFQGAANNFIKVLGTGNEQVKLFGDLWRYATKESLLTGEAVDKFVNESLSALTTGDFGFMRGLPWFKQYEKEWEDFITNVQNVDAPGGMQNRMLYAQRYIELISKASAEQKKSIKSLPGELLKTDETAKQFNETIRNLGNTLTKVLTPAVEKLSDVLNKFLSLYETTEQKGLNGVIRGSTGIDFDVEKIARSNSMLSLKVNLYQEIFKTLSGYLNFRDSKKTSGNMSALNASPLLINEASRNTSNPIHNTFNVKANPTFYIDNKDPAVVAAIVDQRIKYTLEDAFENFINSEGNK